MREVQNPTIARLDRFASRLGLHLINHGLANDRNGVRKTVRHFNLNPDRIIEYRPGGKGVLKVTAYIWHGTDWKLDAETVVSEDRLKKIMTTAQEG